MVKANHPVISMILLEERDQFINIKNQYLEVYKKFVFKQDLTITHKKKSIKRPASEVFDSVRGNFAVFYKDFHKYSISAYIDRYNDKYLDAEIKLLLNESEIDTQDIFRKTLIEKLNKKTGVKSKDYTFNERHLKVINYDMDGSPKKK